METPVLVLCFIVIGFCSAVYCTTAVEQQAMIHAPSSAIFLDNHLHKESPKGDFTRHARDVCSCAGCTSNTVNGSMWYYMKATCPSDQYMKLNFKVGSTDDSKLDIYTIKGSEFNNFFGGIFNYYTANSKKNTSCFEGSNLIDPEISNVYILYNCLKSNASSCATLTKYTAQCYYDLYDLRVEQSLSASDLIVTVKLYGKDGLSWTYGNNVTLVLRSANASKTYTAVNNGGTTSFATTLTGGAYNYTVSVTSLTYGTFFYNGNVVANRSNHATIITCVLNVIFVLIAALLM